MRTVFDEHIPDILFLDVHLAGENGLELLKEIKEKYVSTKVIMVSADNTEETLRAADGVDGYVIKPFLPQHIMVAVDRL